MRVLKTITPRAVDFTAGMKEKIMLPGFVLIFFYFFSFMLIFAFKVYIFNNFW